MDKLTVKEVHAKEETLLANKKPLYTHREIMNLLKEDKFKFNLFGHVDKSYEKEAIKGVKKDILRHLEFNSTYHNSTYHLNYIKELEIAKANGKDCVRNNIETKLGDIDKSIQYHKESIKIFEEMKIRETDSICIGSSEFYCFKCGERMMYALLDENTIGLSPSYSMKKMDIWDCTCKFKDGEKQHSYHITVPTGKLVFVNFFDDRKPYIENDKNRDCYINKDKKEMKIFEPKEKWSEEFNLNTHLGRIGLMNHYSSKHNIAFGQMGDGGIGIYTNKNRDRIVISCAYLANRLTDKDGDKQYLTKIEKFLKEYRKVGQISLEMWRWMAADMSVVEKNKIPVKINKNDYNKDVLLKVKKGKWKVTHKYRTDDCNEDKDIEYSVLELEE